MKGRPIASYSFNLVRLYTCVLSSTIFLQELSSTIFLEELYLQPCPMASSIK